MDLAHAQHHAGQHRSALATALAGLARHPQEGLLHLYTGDACRALRQYDEAFRHWQAAVAIDTKFLDAMYSMAFCLEELGRYPEACTVWEDIARSLMQRGLEIEAQWPREMAEKCRRR